MEKKLFMGKWKSTVNVVIFYPPPSQLKDTTMYQHCISSIPLPGVFVLTWRNRMPALLWQAFSLRAGYNLTSTHTMFLWLDFMKCCLTGTETMVGTVSGVVISSVVCSMRCLNARSNVCLLLAELCWCLWNSPTVLPQIACLCCSSITMCEIRAISWERMLNVGVHLYVFLHI